MFVRGDIKILDDALLLTNFDYTAPTLQYQPPRLFCCIHMYTVATVLFQEFFKSYPGGNCVSSMYNKFTSPCMAPISQKQFCHLVFGTV